MRAILLFPDPVFPDPAGLQPLRVTGDFGWLIAGWRLGRQHARLHRCVRTLDLRHVQEAARVADQHAARKGRRGMDCSPPS